MSEYIWESFTGAFGGTVDFEFRPNATAIATQIEELELSLRDFSLPLRAARERVVANVKEHFEHETAPDGEHWQDWADSYRPKAEAENIGILRKNEDLFEAVTDPSAYPIIGDDLWVATNDFPDYWAVHNYGHTWQKGGSTVTVPQREYLGTDEDTMIETIDIFDAWFGRKLELFAGFGGTVSTKGAGGRFEAF